MPNLNTPDKRFQDCAYCDGAHIESDCLNNPEKTKTMPSNTELDEIEILWKCVNRQGVYARQPIKYTEFQSQIKQLLIKAKIEELENFHLFRTDDGSNERQKAERLEFLKKQLEGDL